MKIGLIGCGKVGLTMCYFLKKDHAITGIYDPDRARVRAGLKILKLRKNPCLKDIVQTSDAVLVATPDDEIAAVSSRLIRWLKKPTLICHFSGLLPAETIPKHRYARRVCLHPFATFPCLAMPPRESRYLLLCQGDRKARRTARILFRKRHFAISDIPRRHKAWYHLLGVFSSNLLIGLMKAADDIARRTRADPGRARAMMTGLMDQTLKNVHDLGLDHALSGPVKRGDMRTVERHIRILRGNKPLLRVYSALSAYLAGLSANTARRKALKKLLQKH